MVLATNWPWLPGICSAPFHVSFPSGTQAAGIVNIWYSLVVELKDCKSWRKMTSLLNLPNVAYTTSAHIPLIKACCMVQPHFNRRRMSISPIGGTANHMAEAENESFFTGKELVQIHEQKIIIYHRLSLCGNLHNRSTDMSMA